MEQKKYWLQGLGIGAAIGVPIYILSVIGMFIIEGCYRIPSGQIGMCGFFTAGVLAFGWIWIIVGLVLGTIIGWVYGKSKTNNKYISVKRGSK